MKGYWRHKGNMKLYAILSEALIKEETTGEWVPGIIYHRENKVFVRTKKNFEERFIQVAEE